MPPKTPQRTLGDRGEDLAVAHLARLGWRILERNVRLRGGEIDCVALDGRTLCFVEIKSVQDGTAIGPEDHVTAAKVRALRRAAAEYLRGRRLDDDQVETRFDVVAVRFRGQDAAITVHRDAL